MINLQLARQNIGLEKYKARLGFWQAIWGTIFVSGVAVAIPVAVNAYGKHLEKEIHDLDLQLKIKDQENAVRQYEKEFMTKFVSQAVDKDINLRLRFTDYFAHLAEEKDAKRWAKFNEDLTTQKAKIWEEIQTLEDRLVTEDLTPEARARFERLVQSYYDEIGIFRTRAIPISSPEVSDQPPPADTALFRIQQSQRNTQHLTSDFLASRFGLPTTGPAPSNRCGDASDPAFLDRLRTGAMLDSRLKVKMLQPLWIRMRSDISKFAKENPDIAGKLVVESFESV